MVRLRAVKLGLVACNRCFAEIAVGQGGFGVQGLAKDEGQSTKDEKVGADVSSRRDILLKNSPHFSRYIKEYGDAFAFRAAREGCNEVSAMYRLHWGLREAPFRSGLDPRFFYQSPNHEEALARLHFLVDERRRVGLCFGPSGGGKSMLLEVFARELRRQGRQVANISLLGADLHEFLWLLAAELGGNPARGDSTFCLWRNVTDRVTENRYQQFDTVFLMDDADEAEPAVLDAIVRLAEVDRSPLARLTLVVTSTTGNARRLGSRLLDLGELRIDLNPWEQADTLGYIVMALRQAGRREAIFTDDAIVRLHHLCDGIPRRILQLANLSLLAGAGGHVDQIDSETVESAFQELAAVEVTA